MNQPWDEFLKVAQPNLARDAHAHVSCMCVRREGTWHGVAASVILSPSSSMLGPVGSWIMEKEGFAAFRGVVPPKAVVALLEGMRKGIMTAESLPAAWGRDVVLRRSAEESFSAWGPHGLTDDQRRRLGLTFQGQHIALNGNQTREVLPSETWQVLERKVPAWTLPARSLAALAERLRIGFSFDNWSSTTATIVSPYWIRIERAVVARKSDAVEIDVFTHWPDAAPRATVTLMPPPGTDTGAEVCAPLDRDGVSRETRDGGVRLSIRLPCDAVVGPWRVSLNYEDAAVESCDVGLPSLRLVAWGLEDPDLSQLRTRLEGKTSPRKNADDDPFEWGVERLLHLCGLQTVRHPEKQATDVIAFEGDQLALFAECTVIAPDDDKINKLADRAEKFRNALREHGRSTTKVLKIVFTPVERARVSAATRKAAYEQRGVVIACREEVELLLDMARQGEPVSRVTEFLTVLPVMHGLRL